jgi:outer membrane protein OmpA-like peptidoglycan-associated protein
MRYAMKYAIFTALALLSAAAAAFGGPDNNPVSTGMTQARNASGLTFDGAFGNPALVGLDRPPKTSLSFFPTSFALWSDKVAPPFNSYLLMYLTDPQHATPMYLTSLMEESFPDIKGKTPEEVSKILTRDFRGGVGIYSGFRTSPLVFSTRGFALNVKTYADVDLRIPEGLLLPFFSDSAGLREGTTLDFSQLDVDAIWASEIGVKLGFSLNVPFISDYLKLDRGAAGVGIKLVLGHMLFQIKTDPSSKNNLYYNESTNKYEMDAKVNITSVGTGFSGDWRYDNPFWSKTVSGQGWGLDLGTVFHNDNHFISLDVQNVGMIFWGDNVYKTSLTFKKEGFDLVDLTDRFDDVFDRGDTKAGDGFWPNREDSLKPVGRLITYLPTALNVGYTYLWDFSNNEDIKHITSYASGSVDYEQQIVLGPGRNTYMPRFTIGAATGFLSGYLPLRYGMIFGGPERIGSAFGFGLDFRYAALDASYKAVGSPFLISKKGFETAAALTFKWGWKKKEKRFRDKEPAPPPPEPEPEYVPEEPPVPEVEPPPVEEAPVIEIVVAPPEPEIVPIPEPEPLPTVEEVKKLETSQKAINFKVGSAELTASSYSALKDIAELLKNYPHVRYEIQGHTDSDGSQRLNLMLSAARAASVRNYMIDQGAPGASLVAIGYGPEKPIANNATVEGRALNRRVEFVLIESQEHYQILQKREAELDMEIKRAGVRGAQRRR